MKMTHHNHQGGTNTAIRPEPWESETPTIWDRICYVFSVLDSTLNTVGFILMGFGVAVLLTGLALLASHAIGQTNHDTKANFTTEVKRNTDGYYPNPADDPWLNGHASAGGGNLDLDTNTGTSCILTVHFIDAMTGEDLDAPMGIPGLTLGDEFKVAAREYPGKTPSPDYFEDTISHQFTDVYFYYVPIED